MKDVVIKIVGKQLDPNGEEDIIELVTEGKFYKKSDVYYLIYDETEISGMKGSTTTLKIDSEKIFMRRFGANASNLIFEKGTKHKSEYWTMYGDLPVEVITNEMNVNITDDGKGNINLAYRVNISNFLESSNQLLINVM